MKNFLILISFVFLFSCNKNDVEPNLEELGFLGNYLKNNPGITILKTSESSIPYHKDVATSRGYFLNPLVDLRLTEFGGRIALPGTYKFEIFIANKLTGSFDIIFVDSINISNTSTFQYKKIDKELKLYKDEGYLIQYFNENHNSVYDAGLGFSQPDTLNNIKFPLVIENIVISVPRYAYYGKRDGEYLQFEMGYFYAGILRGLVDFKYEELK